MDLGLKDATAVVQGGTQGMGLAAAECFAEDGARVAVMARTKSDLDATVEHLQKLGSPEVIPLQADITNREQVDDAFRVVGERWSHLNILVNAAGPAGIGGIEDLSDEEWIDSFDLGAMGMVRCI